MEGAFDGPLPQHTHVWVGMRVCKDSLKPKTPKTAQVLLQKRDVRLNRLPSRLGTSCITLYLPLAIF